MKTQFDLLKKGNVAITVWANAKTKEIYPANRNSFGYNALHKTYDDQRDIGYNGFYEKYGKNLKYYQGKGNFKSFSYSANGMQSVGFQLVLRGDKPLW